MQPEMQQNEVPASNMQPQSQTQPVTKKSNPLMWLLAVIVLGVLGYIIYTFGMDFITGSRKNTELMIYDDTETNVQMEDESTKVDKGKSTQEITNDVISEIDNLQNDKSEDGLTGAELNDL